MGSSEQPKTQGVKRRDVNAAERVYMALDLLKQRLSYREIASRCGYASGGAAYNAIQREMKQRIVPKIDEYRAQELDILDEIHQKVWKVAFETKNKDGKEETNLWATDRLMELSRDRRKLLNLDVQPEEIAAAQVVIREVPAGWLQLPQVVEADQP